MYRDVLEQLLQKPELRSADKANLKGMLARTKAGTSLSYQEEVNLWAYCTRYGVPVYNLRGSRAG